MKTNPKILIVAVCLLILGFGGAVYKSRRDLQSIGGGFYSPQSSGGGGVSLGGNNTFTGQNTFNATTTMATTTITSLTVSGTCTGCGTSVTSSLVFTGGAGTSSTLYSIGRDNAVTNALVLNAPGGAAVNLDIAGISILTLNSAGTAIFNNALQTNSGGFKTTAGTVITLDSGYSQNGTIIKAETDSSVGLTVAPKSAAETSDILDVQDGTGAVGVGFTPSSTITWPNAGTTAGSSTRYEMGIDNTAVNNQLFINVPTSKSFALRLNGTNRLTVGSNGALTVLNGITSGGLAATEGGVTIFDAGFVGAGTTIKAFSSSTVGLVVKPLDSTQKSDILDVVSSTGSVFFGVSSTGLAYFNGNAAFGTGNAVNATNYEIGRDTGGTNQMYFNVPTGAGYRFPVNGSNVFLIDTSGNSQAAGTFIASGGAGSAYGGAIASTVLGITPGADSNIALRLRAHSASTTANLLQTESSIGTASFQIGPAGDVTSTAANIVFSGIGSNGITGNLLCWKTGSVTGTLSQEATSCTISSARYKDHIASMSTGDMLKEVEMLRPVQFDYNNASDQKSGFGTAQDQGMIAEEVAVIDPYMVVYEKNPSAKDLAFEEKNYPKSIIHQGDTVLIPRTIDYGRISVLNTGAIQAQQAEITALQDRTSILERLVKWIQSLFTKK